ncbi:hypothetical protein MKW92_020936, partial [Papaver armeniacum]
NRKLIHFANMKLRKDRLKFSELVVRCESSHSSAHDNRRQRPRSPQACSGPVTPTFDYRYLFKLIKNIWYSWNLIFIQYVHLLRKSVLYFDYRLGKSELANEVPIVNAGIGESEVAGEHKNKNDMASKRLPDSWGPEEIHMLRVAFHYLVKDGKKKPWKDMLEYGHNVFHAGRTNEDLRSKWKCMVNHGQW